MAARRTVLGGVSLGGILLLSVWTGCAADPPPVTQVENPPAAEQAPPEEPPAQPETPPEETPDPPKSQVIVVESGGEGETSSRTLVEAAKAERERKAQAGPPVAVITNKTLPKYATGQVTIAEPRKKAEAGTVAPGPEVKDEQYWRSQGLELRLRWREAEDEVGRLEQSASEWRRRFYAQDDPYVRDGQIKPEWDRTLDRLEEARAEVEMAKQDLARFLEEGRQAGALPGWLREGVDQEPKPKAEEPPPGEPVEPTVLDEDGVKYEPSSPPPRLH